MENFENVHELSNGMSGIPKSHELFEMEIIPNALSKKNRSTWLVQLACVIEFSTRFKVNDCRSLLDYSLQTGTDYEWNVDAHRIIGECTLGILHLNRISNVSLMITTVKRSQSESTRHFLRHSSQITIREWNNNLSIWIIYCRWVVLTQTHEHKHKLEVECNGLQAILGVLMCWNATKFSWWIFNRDTIQSNKIFFSCDSTETPNQTLAQTCYSYVVVSTVSTRCFRQRLYIASLRKSLLPIQCSTFQKLKHIFSSLETINIYLFQLFNAYVV